MIYGILLEILCNDNTLTVYIKRIREKIGDKNGNIITTVRGLGYRVEK